VNGGSAEGAGLAEGAAAEGERGRYDEALARTTLSEVRVHCDACGLDRAARSHARAAGTRRRALREGGRSLRQGIGRRRDRAPRVRRFQEDAAWPLFLVSLKAGGLGLNLTAADTVYLLDPWWNPAVESRAIDRTHRIGQTKPVNAYRLVAKDTIEEKILALQERKRKLADAVINTDASVLRSLTREDLEMLLG
jgi:hypothetical protein